MPYLPPLLSSSIFTESLCASSSPLPQCMIWSELRQAELAWIKRLRKPWVSRNAPPPKKKRLTGKRRARTAGVYLTQNLITLIKWGTYESGVAQNEVRRCERIRKHECSDRWTRGKKRTEHGRKLTCMLRLKGTWAHDNSAQVPISISIYLHKKVVL